MCHPIIGQSQYQPPNVLVKNLRVGQGIFSYFLLGRGKALAILITITSLPIPDVKDTERLT